MEEQVIKKLIELDQRVDGMAIPEKPIDLISPFLALPGLRGFWPMSAFDSSGNAQDQSGHAHHLTYNGNPTYNYTGLAPYLDLDGTLDLLDRGDEADLDILGTENYVANPGLTLGGWFWSDSISTQYGLITKNGGAGQRSYWMQFFSSETYFSVSVDGTAETQIALGTNLSSNSWYFCAGRFNPSTELKVFTNELSAVNTTSIPAAIFNSTAALNIGGLNSGLLLNGRASLCFLCATMLTDAQISSLFQTTRAAFGV